MCKKSTSKISNLLLRYYYVQAYVTLVRVLSYQGAFHEGFLNQFLNKDLC